MLKGIRDHLGEPNFDVEFEENKVEPKKEEEFDEFAIEEEAEGK